MLHRQSSVNTSEVHACKVKDDAAGTQRWTLSMMLQEPEGVKESVEKAEDEDVIHEMTASLEQQSITQPNASSPTHALEPSKSEAMLATSVSHKKAHPVRAAIITHALPLCHRCVSLPLHITLEAMCLI